MRPGWAKVDQEDEARRRITASLPATMRGHLVAREERDPHVATLMGPLWEEMAEPGIWFSPQNYVLAALPSVAGRGLEVGTVADDTTTAALTVPRLVMEREGLLFPVVDQTKVALLSDARRRGFDHLLAMTWTCEGVTAEPCGKCEPCTLRLTM